MTALVDSHTHVQTRQFRRERYKIVRAALEAGVTRMVVPGTDVASSQEALAMARDWPGHLFPAAGVHPHDASTLTGAAYDQISALAHLPEVVAVGEIGLDYYRDLSPRDVQKAAIIRQFELAREVDKPVILHNRDSHEDMIAVLKAHAQGLRGVFHCFIGNRQMARDALDLGFYLSFSGVVTYAANATLQEVAAWAPLDRILIETDAPYLPPEPYRRQRNEPAYVVVTARYVAELRSMAFEDLAEATSRNAAALFGLPDAPDPPAEQPVSATKRFGASPGPADESPHDAG